MDLESFGALLVNTIRPVDRPLLVAMAGAPGVGKSTAVIRIQAMLHVAAITSVVVPMDGFHLSNAALSDLGLSHRKGAPETFDVDGLAAMLTRVSAGSRPKGVVRPGEHRSEAEERSPGVTAGPHGTVWAPVFDRSIEAAVAGSIAVDPGVQVVLVEGNYVLMDVEPWLKVSSQFDVRAYLQHADDVVRVNHLIARHVANGRTLSEATEWVMRSDEANARTVEQSRQSGDHLIEITFN